MKTHTKRHKDPPDMFSYQRSKMRKTERQEFTFKREKHPVVLLGTDVGICTNPSQHRSSSLVWQWLLWDHHPKTQSETPLTQRRILRKFQNKL